MEYELNRAFRRRMKKGAKLAKTPTREEASELLASLKADFAKTYDLKKEPVKVRIPRAFEGTDAAQ